jgi:hypothetical protein
MDWHGRCPPSSGKEGPEMATDARDLRIREAMHVDRGTVKMRAKKVFSKGWVTVTAVAAVTVAVLVHLTGFLCQVA